MFLLLFWSLSDKYQVSVVGPIILVSSIQYPTKPLLRTHYICLICLANTVPKQYQGPHSIF